MLPFNSEMRQECNMLHKVTILPDSSGSIGLAGHWVELVYSISFLHDATRPALLMTDSVGAMRRELIPAPVLGRAVWIGLIPHGTSHVSIESRVPLRLDRVTPRSLIWRFITACMRHPRHALAAAVLFALGRQTRSQRRFMRALTERSFAGYAAWAGSRRRVHDPETLDRPSTEALNLRDEIEAELSPGETLMPYALDAVATAFAENTAITAIQGDSEISASPAPAAGFASAWTPSQGAIFRRRGAIGGSPRHLRRILTVHGPKFVKGLDVEIPAVWPKVMVIVPTRDRLDLLTICVNGVLEKTEYPSLELTIADNDSTDPATQAYLQALPARDYRARVIACPGVFNFSNICNRAAFATEGDVIVFLNNDISVTDSSWLKSLVALAISPQTGAVGPTLLFPNGRIQHAGVALGAGGTAGHILAGKKLSALENIRGARRVSAVTGACLVVRRDLFEAVGGFDPAFAVAYNDIDLCLRLGARGWGAIWSPEAALTHLESASRGSAFSDEAATKLFRERWASAIADDPFFHPAFSSAALDLSLG